MRQPKQLVDDAVLGEDIPVVTNNSSALKSLAFFMLQVHAGVP
jgi:hypothetical protein